MTDSLSADRHRSQMQQLWDAVELLARPAGKQIQYLTENGVGPDELALTFDDAFIVFKGNADRRREVSSPQFVAMTALDSALDAMSDDATHWTTEAVRSDRAWEEVRKLASAAMSTRADEQTVPI